MKIHILIILSILIASVNSYSQDTINLMSGKQIIAKSIFEDTSSTLIKYDIAIKNRVIQKAVDRIDIFSITYADKSHSILYHQDTAIGFRLSYTEMNNYLLGEREALNHYKAPLVTVGGFAAGFAPTTFFLNFYGALFIPVYATALGVITPKVKTPENGNSKLFTDDNFIDGYKSTATRKKVKNALLGSVVGFATAIIVMETVYLGKIK